MSLIFPILEKSLSVHALIKTWRKIYSKDWILSPHNLIPGTRPISCSFPCPLSVYHLPLLSRSFNVGYFYSNEGLHAAKSSTPPS